MKVKVLFTKEENPALNHLWVKKKQNLKRPKQREANWVLAITCLERAKHESVSFSMNVKYQIYLHFQQALL